MWVDRSDPTRPFFNPTTEGLLPLRTWLCESRDGGRSWRDYRFLNDEPHLGPLALTGPSLILGDGRLACQFEVNKHYEDTGSWRHAAAWKVSCDRGYSWPEYIEVANDAAGRLMYWDARYSIGDNGYVVAAFWTYDRLRQCDANIHLSESRDGGRTWSAPRDCGLLGQVCYPVLVAGGRMALIYVDRFRSRSVRAALSDDLGRSFTDDIVVYQHPSVQAERGRNSASADYLQDMEFWTFGRIEAISGGDGTVWIVYYAGHAQATDIRWARIQVSRSRQFVRLHPHVSGAEAAAKRSAVVGVHAKFDHVWFS
jgi:hypothetical protein